MILVAILIAVIAVLVYFDPHPRRTIMPPDQRFIQQTIKTGEYIEENTRESKVAIACRVSPRQRIRDNESEHVLSV